ncbi:uncharacterized protein LOC142522282 [Primulina tabacum]|uniref:uncharacterized protein LOC142522282 n=1 Tax=Primulina tabacum TaxID=48773 RepID=UPI003F5946B1
MQTSILCCSSNSTFPSNFQRFMLLSKNHPVNVCAAVFSSSSKSLLASSRPRQSSRSTSINSSAAPELVGTNSSTLGFIETGYISGVHGLQGEVRVKPSTDFPDLRFSKPGTRWLKQKLSGTETLQEIELLEGRGHPGQSWILKFNEIDTVEQARKLVGSTLLVTDKDRPVLEEGEFYTRDLIGMKVILKESGEPVGIVVNVFNTGASDLLQVRLDLSKNIAGPVEVSKVEECDSGPLAWVPFVEAIVPDVDLEKREMLITPPKGLLDLNVRAHERSKKERRELEWKERKKFQRQLIAAKKKLCEMEQQHVFYGFKYGEKDKTSLLANEIVTVNSKLLQQALQHIETPSIRQNVPQILSAVPKDSTLKVADTPVSAQGGKLSNLYWKLQREGDLLASGGKVATCLVLEEVEEIERGPNNGLVNSKEIEKACLLVKELLDDPQRLVEVKNRPSVPLVFVCPAHSIGSLQELFSLHDHFAFDPQKVWFLEEETLPVVSSSLDEHGKHKILMKSPWEFLQRPIGSGGFISLLSSQDLLDRLSEMGVEYIEVCSTSGKQKHTHGSAFLGLVDSCKANIGIRLYDATMSEEHFDMLFSTSFMKKWVNHIDKLQFDAVLTSHSYVEKVDKDWIDITPSTPNSYEFHCWIYSCLDACSPKKICVLDSAE